MPLYRFEPPVGTPYGLEVTTLEEFHIHHDNWPWNPPRPGRASFHYMILVSEGELRHDVDHVTRTVVPGQWLWVRPGHAQCWHEPDSTRGTMILFEPDVLGPDTAVLAASLTASDAPAVLTPHPDDASWLRETALQLLNEHRALGRRPLAVHHALRRSLLEALLLRLLQSQEIGRTQNGSSTGRREIYDLFLDGLEFNFRELSQAADYAKLLGYSVRTLSRAVQEATGMGVRAVINDRRMLEARRLLGNAQWTPQAVAGYLGYTDAANFGRSFRQFTGVSPAAFAAGDRRP